MWRLDNPNASLFLLFHNLLMQLMHFGPMHLRLVMMFRMVAVVEPDQIVNLVVTAHAPSHRLVRVSTKMAVITVQVREAMTEIIEWQIEKHKLPVQEKADDDQNHPGSDFEDSPVCVEGITLFDFSKDRFGVIAEIAQENVRPDILRFVIVAMLVDGNWIDRLSFSIWEITVTLMVLEMNQVIELLGIAHRYRQQPAEKSVGRFPLKVRIMNEIVSDPVDIPGDADGVNKTENQHDP